VLLDVLEGSRAGISGSGPRMSGFQLEGVPTRKPTAVRVWWLNDDGTRVKLYERRGLGQQFTLGRMILNAVGLLGASPLRPKAVRATRRRVKNVTPTKGAAANARRLALNPASNLR
jgi:hypothetical protein